MLPIVEHRRLLDEVFLWVVFPLHVFVAIPVQLEAIVIFQIVIYTLDSEVSGTFELLHDVPFRIINDYNDVQIAE